MSGSSSDVADAGADDRLAEAHGSLGHHSAARLDSRPDGVPADLGTRDLGTRWPHVRYFCKE